MGDNGHVRVAAVGDIHVRESDAGHFHDLFTDISGRADVLVLCGDVTNRGLPREAEVLVEELRSCRIPVLAVLGNHDTECGHEEEVVQILCSAGVMMLEDEPREVMGVGFAGVKGFCGGFGTHMLAPFGEHEIKDFVNVTVQEALRLESALLRLRTEHKVAVLHYAPVRDTVVGEPPEIFPFLGSTRLAEPLDRFGVSLCVHGHAHHGAPEGATTTGIPVYNVAHAIMREIDEAHPYRVLGL
jgi:Icc-related predicted phosphoesterase